MVRVRGNGTLNLSTSLVLLPCCVTVMTSSTTPCGQRENKWQLWYSVRQSYRPAIVTYLWSEVGKKQWVHYTQLWQDCWSEWKAVTCSHICCHLAISAITGVTWTHAELKLIAAIAIDTWSVIRISGWVWVAIELHLNVNDTLPWYLKGGRCCKHVA